MKNWKDDLELLGMLFLVCIPWLIILSIYFGAEMGWW